LSTRIASGKNAGGYLQYLEDIGTATEPAFADRGYLKAADQVIHHIAGPNGSVQGPAERKWGYTNPSIGDWNLSTVVVPTPAKMILVQRDDMV
jgi:hypothetical protein